MFKTIALSMAGLAAAAAFPLVLYSGANAWKGVRQDGRPVAPVAAVPAEPSAAGAAPAVAMLPGMAPSLPPLEGAPAPDLAEVFRFDVTPDWVLRRWPRVSTGLAQIQYQGYRVPLVTGTAESDLAGILTYYFTPQQQVDRITFRGTTGDLRKLLALLVNRYHFTRRLTNDASLLVYEAVHANGEPASAVRIRSAAIVKAADPYHRFDVELVLQRPRD